MILIFEGADKSGKTTLCQRLVDEFNFKYFKSSRQMGSKLNLEEAIKYDWLFLLDFFNQTNFSNNVIFDRSFISQYAYSLVYRESSVMKNHKTILDYREIFRFYMGMLKKLDFYVIYCYRSNYKGVSDEIADLSVVGELKKRYEELLNDLFRDDRSRLIRCKFGDGVEFNYNKIKEITGCVAVTSFGDT